MALADSTRTGPEQKVRQAILTGRLVDLRAGQPEADDPAHGADWDEQRTVRAEVLADLLTQQGDKSRPRALRLAGARILGQLDLEAVELVCPLLLGGCWFAEPVILAEARASALRLPGCHLPGLSGDQLTTRGDLSLSNGFTASDMVRLRGAHIGGTLDLRGATLTNPDGWALFADQITIDHHMLCREGFTAQGEINLLGARIGGQLDLTGATLTKVDGYALRLQELQANTLFLRDLTEPPAQVDFAHARVGMLVDEPASWPRQARLDGFVYDALYERDPVSARQRLDWLTRSPRHYNPQPYEQLVTVYRRAGRDQDARTVAIAKQRARRSTLGPAGRLWSLLLDILVGYGYRTWQALLWLVGFLLVGWEVFHRAYPAHLISTKKPGDPLPAFQPFIYSLDTLLPIVDLQQQNNWMPRGGVKWWAWASILAGWVLTTVIIAAVTGILKRD
jgi:hypothetical protein